MKSTGAPIPANTAILQKTWREVSIANPELCSKATTAPWPQQSTSAAFGPYVARLGKRIQTGRASLVVVGQAAV